MDRIKIEEITKDKIAGNLFQGEQVYCFYPYYNASDNYGIHTENLLFNSMYKNKTIINAEGARFFIVKVSPSYIDEIESENNE